MAIAITRDDLSASQLRQAAARSNDSSMARRALALALVLEGKSRAEAARSAGMDRQTLRDWVRRYNELGLEGLKNRHNPGAPPRKRVTDYTWCSQGMHCRTADGDKAIAGIVELSDVRLRDVGLAGRDGQISIRGCKPEPQKIPPTTKGSRTRSRDGAKTSWNQRHTVKGSELARPAAEAPWTDFPENDTW